MKNPKLYLLFILITILLSSYGCSEQIYNDSNQLVFETKKAVNTVSAGDFRKIMGRGENYKLIDCREAEEFKSGHMPGAINIPRGLLEFEITDLSPLRGTRIYIYCETGERSILSAETLQEMKYSNVTSIEGGWGVWAKEYPDKIELIDNKKEIKKDTIEKVVSSGGGCGG